MRCLPFMFMLFLIAVPATVPADMEQQETAVLTPAVSGPVLPYAPLKQSALESQRADLGRELQKLQDSLPAKKKELALLRRKWTMVKGRVPSAEEIAAFEKKRAQGKAGEKDNPYVNRNPLSMPGPAREAYYRKLDEVRQDEERIARLRKELDAQDR